MASRSSWLTIHSPLTGRRAAVLKVLSFLLPLAAWALISYVPWIWHPMVSITDPGGLSYAEVGDRLPRESFILENQRLASEGEQLARGVPANPLFFPAPHEVAMAFYKAFITPPELPDDPWLHQSLARSAEVIFLGFLLAAVTGVPLGILCGTFDVFSKLCEPFVDFIRYMPYPMFSGLVVTILGIETAPKIAIVWVGLFFQMVLVVANTTRNVDVSLLEAAQTLGATRKSLLPKVVLPAILPNLYNDLRIMLGVAWTILIIAELQGGVISGISRFLNIEQKHRHFDNVYAGMLMIGIIGLACDQFLSAAAPIFFPWLPRKEGANWLAAIVGAVTFMPQRAIVDRSARRRARRLEAESAAAAPSDAVNLPPDDATARTLSEAPESQPMSGRAIDVSVG